MPDPAARLARAIDCWNAGDLDGYLTLYDEGIRLHGYSPEPMDKAAVAAFYEGIGASLSAPGRPNPDLAIYEVLVEGNRLACRFTMSGVHGGDFMGIPASGRPYQLDGITVLHFDGDQVVERWSTADFLGMLTQLGAIPAMS